MASNTKKFRDISMVFQSHPVTNDIATKSDVSAVKQSIRNLVLTQHYERPFHPEKGCQIYSLLFENINAVTLQIARQVVINVLTQYEPRANILDVVIEDQSIHNAVNVTIYFTVINSDIVEQVSVYVDDLR